MPKDKNPEPFQPMGSDPEPDQKVNPHQPVDTAGGGTPLTTAAPARQFASKQEEEEFAMEKVRLDRMGIKTDDLGQVTRGVNVKAGAPHEVDAVVEVPKDAPEGYGPGEFKMLDGSTIPALSINTSTTKVAPPAPPTPETDKK